MAGCLYDLDGERLAHVAGCGGAVVAGGLELTATLNDGSLTLLRRLQWSDHPTKARRREREVRKRREDLHCLEKEILQLQQKQEQQQQAEEDKEQQADAKAEIATRRDAAAWQRQQIADLVERTEVRGWQVEKRITVTLAPGVMTQTSLFPRPVVWCPVAVEAVSFDIAPVSFDIALDSRPRQEAIVVLGGTVDGTERSTVFTLPVNQSPPAWTSALPAFTRPRATAAAAVSRDQLYLVGGYDGQTNTALSSVERLCLTSRRWATAPNLLVPRMGAAAVALGGHVYVCGGRTSAGWSDTVGTTEKYDPVEEKWSCVGSMTRVCSMHALVAMRGSLYAVGGATRQGKSLCTAERYDVARDVWTPLPHMGERRCNLAAAHLHGKLYVLGGYGDGNGLRTVECYDPQTNRWTAVAPMTTPRWGHGAVVVDGKLYAVGGQAPDAPAVECFDAAVGAWSDYLGGELSCRLGKYNVVTRIPLYGPAWGGAMPGQEAAR